MTEYFDFYTINVCIKIVIINVMRRFMKEPSD